MNRNGPITQVEVEDEIRRLCIELEEHTEAYEELMLDEARKAARFKGAWAREYIEAAGPVSQREAYADWKLEKENFEWKVAEALAKAKREKLNAIRAQLDGYRTLNANTRALAQ